MKPSFAFVTLSLAFCGCATSEPPFANRAAYVKPGLIMLTAEQAARREVTADDSQASAEGASRAGLDARAVLAGGQVKAYSVGRYPDPADPDVLHEAHVVYRRETAPRWRLAAPVDQQVLVGPRVSDGRGELQPVLSKELAAYLADQRKALEANQRAIAALFAALEKLNAARDGHGGAAPARPERRASTTPSEPASSGELEDLP